MPGMNDSRYDRYPCGGQYEVRIVGLDGDRCRQRLKMASYRVCKERGPRSMLMESMLGGSNDWEGS